MVYLVDVRRGDWAIRCVTRELAVIGQFLKPEMEDPDEELFLRVERVPEEPRPGGRP